MTARIPGDCPARHGWPNVIRLADSAELRTREPVPAAAYPLIAWLARTVPQIRTVVRQIRYCRHGIQVGSGYCDCDQADQQHATLDELLDGDKRRDDSRAGEGN